MSGDPQAFRAFEHAGWQDPQVCSNYHERFSQVTLQSVDALLDAAGVRGGSRVLDVATGAGYVAGAAMTRGADAIGVDFSEQQIALARRLYPGVRFQVAAADALPFDDDQFDCVVSAFGMPHFPDPARALSEASRVLKPNGRVAFTVWDAPERAIAFGAVYAAIRAHGSVDVGLPAGPSFFLFSDAAECKRALAAAQLSSTAVTAVPQTWWMDSPDEAFDTILHGTVRASAMLRAQTPAARDAVRHAMREVIGQFRSGNRYAVPMPAVLASAIKPV
jgi:SAM-dependent methyltransferase